MQIAIGQRVARVSSVWSPSPEDEVSLRRNEGIQQDGAVKPKPLEIQAGNRHHADRGKGEAEVERKEAWPLQDPGRAGTRRDGRGVPRHRPADRARGRAEDAASRSA